MSVTAAQVKKLRDKTGAGFMDCKKALVEANGEIEKAIEYLRKKGMASVKKRAGRQAREGIIESYIHPGNRLGVLVEINCETDFVAKTKEFRDFAKDIAMQIAAANPQVISRDQIEEEELNRELEIYKTQGRNAGKPEKVVEKIAQGKLGKYFQEVCLLEQSYIRDVDKTINELLSELIAKVGENIEIRRFVRFQLGEE